ncbi:hypothetical protein ACWCPS_38975 [Streptomyces mauvecolor]
MAAVVPPGWQAGRRDRSGQAGTVIGRPRCRAKNQTALPASNLGSSSCLPEFTCNDFSIEAEGVEQHETLLARDVLVVPLRVEPAPMLCSRAAA